MLFGGVTISTRSSHTMAQRRAGVLMNGTYAVPANPGVDFANENKVPSLATATGLLAETRVRVPGGLAPLATLGAGATVLTATGPARLRHVIEAEHDQHAFMLRAPYFGLDQDMIVAANTRIALRCDAASYLFGVSTVHVPAWALRDNQRVVATDLGRKERMVQVQLNHDEMLLVGDCEVAGLNRPVSDDLRVLDDAEARCFAAEYKSGYFS